MGDITLRKALDDYKTVYMAYRNFATRTRVEYQNDLMDLVKYAQRSGVEHVSGVGSAIIHKYVAQLEERGYSSLTRKRKVVSIRSFLLFLYQDGYIDTNIAAKIILPFTETTTPYVLTQSECEQLRKACAGNPRDAAIVEVLLQTGIRLSELTRLTLNDIDLGEKRGAGELDSGFIRILGGRGKKERTIPLNSTASSALKSYLDARKDNGSSLLFINRFGEPLGQRGIQKIIRKYLKIAEIGAASVHTLRHTFGAYELAKGTKLRAVQEEMGLRDVRSISLYIALGKEMIRKKSEGDRL